MTNVCEKIQCPYFSTNHKKSFGCQKYSYAFQCHLWDNSGALSLLAFARHGQGEYYISSGEMDEESILELAKINCDYLDQDSAHQRHLKFKNGNYVDGVEFPLHDYEWLPRKKTDTSEVIYED